MAVHVVRGFLPGVDEEEMSAALASALAAGGYAEKERLRLPAGRLRSGLPEGVQAVAWWRTDAGDGAAALDWILPGRERWDLALMRALSSETGGFGALMESARTRDQYGAALFYAGRAVELAGLDAEHRRVRLGDPPPLPPGGEEEAVAALFEHWFSAATQGHPHGLRRPEEGDLHVWIVERRSPAGDPYELGPEPPLARAALALVEEDVFREALQGAEGWRWQARRTDEIGLPYVLLERDGPLDEELLIHLAAACGSSAAAVELPGLSWLEAEPGGDVRRGLGRGADDLLRLWDRFSAVLAAAPGSVRWREIPRLA